MSLFRFSSDRSLMDPPLQPTNCYRPSGQGDVFLFSPSLASRSSNDSSAPTSSSFDALTYAYSPSDLSAQPWTHASPSSRSPFFVEAYLSSSQQQSVSYLSPSSSFPGIYASSPAGYWQTSSVSPVSRNSSHIKKRARMDEDDSDEAAPQGKIQSLLEYKKAREGLDSPPPGRPSSPSTLSALSSAPSSPSALFSALPASSSQTSIARSPASSPVKNSSLVSPRRPSNGPSLARYPHSSQRGTRSQKLSLAPKILTRLGRSQGRQGLQAVTAVIDLTGASSDDEADSPRTLKKRGRRTESASSPARKRAKTDPVALAPLASTSIPPDLGDEDEDDGDAGPSYPDRTFPLCIPINREFSLFYRRFPAISVMDKDLAAAHGLTVPRVADGTPNPPRELLDLYTPRFVKGKGTTKVGLCPICFEPTARGGEGKKVWLSMKFSAFKYYHMQYAHGISALSGRPFSPPTAFRTAARPHAGKHEKTAIKEGRCHRCKKWAPVEGIKDVPTKVKEIFWWKHAATCHQGSTILGEGDVFVEDGVYAALTALCAAGASVAEDSAENA